MQYNIHLPYYNETFLYGYGFVIRYEHDVLYVNGEEQYSFRFFHFLFCTFFHEFFATPFHQHYPDRA